VFSSLSGPLPATLPLGISDLNLNNNNFSGDPPLWSAPKLIQLNLANTPLNGMIPPGWWERMPKLEQFDASSCGLIGTIPDAAAPRSFSFFTLSNNRLTGSLPSKISAAFYSVDNNRLSGAVSVPTGTVSMSVRFLNIAHNHLSCPIRLSHLKTLKQLSMQDGGFAGCDFNDPTQVQLPDTLTSLDVSSLCTICAATGRCISDSNLHL
jgi:hypothetical protein